MSQKIYDIQRLVYQCSMSWNLKVWETYLPEKVCVGVYYIKKHCAAKRNSSFVLRTTLHCWMTNSSWKRIIFMEIMRKGNLEKFLPSEGIDCRLRKVWFGLFLKLFKAAPIEITSVLHSIELSISLEGEVICQISVHAWREWGGQLQKKILNANSFFILTEKQYWMQTMKTPHTHRLCNKQNVDRAIDLSESVIWSFFKGRP